MHAVVAEGIGPDIAEKDKEFMEQVRHHFAAQVDEGMRVLHGIEAASTNTGAQEGEEGVVIVPGDDAV